MSEREEALEALYAEIPDAGCKGLCVDSCGPIVATALEAGRMYKASGRRLDVGDDGRCSYLNAAGRCSVYAVRPLICRLFGSVDHKLLRCPFGCAPEASMTNTEARLALRRSRDIGGPPVQVLSTDLDNLLAFMEAAAVKEIEDAAGRPEGHR